MNNSKIFTLTVKIYYYLRTYFMAQLMLCKFLRFCFELFYNKTIIILDS